MRSTASATATVAQAIARTIESYERSLALNPKNPDLVKRLAQMRETPVRTK